MIEITATVQITTRAVFDVEDHDAAKRRVIEKLNNAGHQDVKILHSKSHVIKDLDEIEVPAMYGGRP